MTVDRIVLIEPIKKGADGDQLSGMLAFAAEQLMGLELRPSPVQRGTPTG